MIKKTCFINMLILFFFQIANSFGDELQHCEQLNESRPENPIETSFTNDAKNELTFGNYRKFHPEWDKQLTNFKEIPPNGDHQARWPKWDHDLDPSSCNCVVMVNNEKEMKGVSAKDLYNFLIETKNWVRYYPNISNVKVASKVSSDDSEMSTLSDEVKLSFTTFGAEQSCDSVQAKKIKDGRYYVPWVCYGFLTKIQHRFLIKDGDDGSAVMYSQECQRGLTIWLVDTFLGLKRTMQLGHALQLDSMYCAVKFGDKFMRGAAQD